VKAARCRRRGYGAAMDEKDFDCEKLAARLAEVKSKMGLGGTE
jgi:hypothetical protein